MRHDDHERRDRLRHVYWLGGGSGAGKTTIARRLAEEYALRLYSTDDAMADHTRCSTAQEAPLLAAFAAMGMDERWVSRTPETMLETFHWFNGECFDLIIEDLLGLPRKPAIIVEGFRLLPHLVQPLLTDPSRALWLLPTSRFRRSVFERRGGPTWGFVAATSDPQRALRNLLTRDSLFTQRLTEQTRRFVLPHITIDQSANEDETLRRIATAYGLRG